MVSHLTAASLFLLAISGVVSLGGVTPFARTSIHFAVFTIAALAIGWHFSCQRPLRVTATFAVCCALPFWGVLQLVLGTSVHDFGTRNAVLDSAAFAALVFVATESVDHPAVRRQFIQALFVFGFGVSAVALVVPIESERISSGHYCVFVELLLPIGIYLICEARNQRTRYLWAVLCASTIASVLITGSRTGSILIAVELIAVPALLLPSKWARAREVLMPFAAMTALVGIFAAGVGWRGLTSRFGPGETLQNREELVASAVNMVRDRPWTGFGLGSFETIYPAYGAADGRRIHHARNDWAEWTATGGVPLLAMYVTVFGLTLPLVRRHAWAMGGAVMFLHALVDSPFEVPALVVIDAILLGAASASDDVP